MNQCRCCYCCKIIELCLRYLSFDPNYNYGDDDNDDEGQDEMEVDEEEDDDNEEDYR